jgi:mRNA-degrading endonuclease RelE of RelBE toxin-antitoxin system
LTRGKNNRLASVTVTPSALKELVKLPRVIRERIGKLFERLEDWPDVSGAKPLSGNPAGWFRLQAGEYRVWFRVQAENVIVDKIGRRSDFYED